jgi:outer membrane protein OmpA-like peptidoglycan-associated protein
MKKPFFLLLTGLFLWGTVVADEPDWIRKFPFSDAVFYGVGQGSDIEAAQASARRVILMQLSSHVEAAVHIEERSGATTEQVTEQMQTFFGSNSLRGAVLTDSYNRDDQFWALMEYPADCGKRLMATAVIRYEEVFGYQGEQIIQELENPEVKEKVIKLFLPDMFTLRYDPNYATTGKVPDGLVAEKGEVVLVAGNTGGLQRRGHIFSGWNNVRDGSGETYSEGRSIDVKEDLVLYALWTALELNLDEYRSEVIDVRWIEDKLMLTVFDFLPDSSEISSVQAAALEELSRTLFLDIHELEYTYVDIVGHANATGAIDEGEALEYLSRRRAEVMAAGLKEAGINIRQVLWEKGDKPIADPSSAEGRGKNRRVEIIVYFE